MKKVAKRETQIPKPGSPVRGSRSGEPIMAVFDLLGRRWAMGVLWVLNQNGSCTFRQLQAHCETVSPSVLNTRLKELREAGLVEHSGSGYEATAEGVKLYELLRPLGQWASGWAARLDEDGRD